MRRVTIVLIASLAIATLHAPSLGFDFLDWDDTLHVTRNPAVLAPDTVAPRDRLTTPSLGYPIPVTIESYALEVKLLGLRPWHFHFFNVLLHVMTSGLVFAIGLRLGLSHPAAAFAMLLFGLHPVVAEPVSWVTGRKDLLSALLALCALGVAWPPSTARRRALAWVCFALGLLSKPAIAPLCLLIAIAAIAFETPAPITWRERARTALQSIWPYLAILTPIVMLGIAGQRAVGAIVDADRAGAGYARAIWYALGHHLRLAFGLEEPTVKYVPSPWPPAFSAGVDLMPLAAAALIAAGLWLAPLPQRRAFGLGAAWAALMYLPNANLIPLARYLADSYVYVPLIGIAWCAGALLDTVAARVPSTTRVLRYTLPLSVVIVCGPSLLLSAARFGSDRALWEHALRRYPHNARVCRQWANGVEKADGPVHGLAATDRCVEMFGEALFARNKGVLLGKLGRFDEARAWLERAQHAKADVRPGEVPR